MIMTLITIILVSICSNTFAEKLTPIQLYLRCYSQLTRSQAKESDQIYQRVKSGQVDPVDACMQLLERAKLNKKTSLDYTLDDVQDSVALSVLKTMHDLHRSWFLNTNFKRTLPSADAIPLTMDLYDPAEPALYFTRSLFVPGVKFDETVRLEKSLRHIRANGNPKEGMHSKLSIENLGSGLRGPGGAARPRWEGASFAATGAFVGIQENAQIILPTGFIYGGSDSNDVNLMNLKNIDTLKPLGGGAMGSQPYLLLNLITLGDYRADGSIHLPRKWAKSVMKDFLCHDLPALHTSDAKKFVDKKAEAGFRHSTNCMQCHSTIDRMSGVVRNSRYVFSVGDPTNATDPYSVHIGSYLPQSGLEEVGFSSVSDKKYFLRKSTGNLYYRNFSGALVDISLHGLSSLGQAIAQQPDYYLCAASRYYEYFTGRKVNLKNLSLGNNNPKTILNELDYIKKLARDLQISQKASLIIEQIFRSPVYQERYFKVTDE